MGGEGQQYHKVIGLSPSSAAGSLSSSSPLIVMGLRMGEWANGRNRCCKNSDPGSQTMPPPLFFTFSSISHLLLQPVYYYPPFPTTITTTTTTTITNTTTLLLPILLLTITNTTCLLPYLPQREEETYGKGKAGKTIEGAFVPAPG